MMRCEDARRVLLEAEGFAVVTNELASARLHVEECCSCRERRAAEVTWRSALQSKLPVREASPDLKERVLAALSRARFAAALGRQRRRWMAAVGSLLFLTLGLGSMWWWREARSDGPLPAALVEDHLLSVSRESPVEFPSSDPRAVTEWFTSRVDFAARAPAISGASLLGGRLCTLAGRRAAVAFYRGEGGEGGRISLFQMAAEDVALGSLRKMQAGGKDIGCAHRKGVSVLLWTERGVLYALVSEIREEELVRLAATI